MSWLRPDDIEMLVDHFAMESFRDMADGDYIAARMAYRAHLISQALWASEQAIEKYLKTILLLRRIPWKKTTHSVLDILDFVEEKSSKLALSDGARGFIKHIDRYGMDRYLTYPFAVEGPEIVLLDRTAWELRRYCTRCSSKLEFARIEAAITEPPRRFRPSMPGLLDEIIDDPKHPSWSYLVKGNRYFGVTTDSDDEDTDDNLGFQGTNSFLSRYPEGQYPDLYFKLKTLVYLPPDAGNQVLPPKHR